MPTQLPEFGGNFQQGETRQAMQYDSLDHFLKTGQTALAKGLAALIFAEDDVELDGTPHHH